MALMTCHIYSSTLQRNTEIFVIIPTPEGNEQITDKTTVEQYHYKTGLPVLYLLHGAYGDASSWIRNSCIERYAQQHRCCVVTASCGNNFYQDTEHGDRYETFFTEELPGLIQNLFPVSRERKDTCIAGFSMGGYGAWFLALRHPQLYAKAASMSGALDIARTYRQVKDKTISGPFPWNQIFHDPEKLEGSSCDLLTLYQNCRKEGTIPELYQTCGTEDFLYNMNLDIRDRLLSLGSDHIYTEAPGGHDWNYWDYHIRAIMDWMFNREKS